jgi:nucleotidyltransferase AbiEii toxin of type IV toxin-antitoxin system
MSLRVKYPSVLKADGYLKPFVKIECGARGALEPTVQRKIAPYIQTDLGTKLDLSTDDVTLISAERTFCEKTLILHGIYCGFRDDNKRPGDGNLISRHTFGGTSRRDRRACGLGVTGKSPYNTVSGSPGVGKLNLLICLKSVVFT